MAQQFFFFLIATKITPFSPSKSIKRPNIKNAYRFPPYSRRNYSFFLF
uniref:Uncharacterized protein n=1 Tax=Rhizophora mucronata TaxID=61149 RepID=A0A2P2PQC9_RHIMU